MKKKGAIHIDWMVSFGIFIVYVLILLVWIKPGYTPSFEEKSLIEIVKSNVEKDYSLSVEKKLLQINKCSNKLGNYNLNKIPEDLIKNNFKLVRFDNGEDVAYWTANNRKLRIEIYDENKNSYWIVSSEDFFYEENRQRNLPTVNCNEVIFGESIIKKGLRSMNLDLDSSSWGFPLSREFKLIINNLKTESSTCYTKTGSVNCNDFEPDGDVVYSSEWRYNLIIDENGNSEAVLINIIVW
jgi:hypothetical protein